MRGGWGSESSSRIYRICVSASFGESLFRDPSSQKDCLHFPLVFFLVCLLFTSFFRVLLSAHLSRGGHRRCDDYAGSFRGAPIMDARKEQQELQSPEWGSMRRPCSSWLRSTLRAPSRRAVPGVVDVCGPRLWFLRREWHAFQGRLRILPFTVCVRSLKNKQKG